MLKTILIVVVVLMAAWLGFAATRPDTFEVQRSITVKAPPDKLFALIDNLHNFNRWNPFLAKDPQLEASHSGPPAGPGASFAWQGNKDIGKGSMTVTRSQAPTQVLMDLHIVEPFEALNQVEFTLQPDAAATQVTWALRGPSPTISKVMGLVFNMDRMIGTDFEVGLAQLKALAEQN